jgi:hypothetical protein
MITKVMACIRHAARGMTDTMPRDGSCRVRLDECAAATPLFMLAIGARGMIMVSSLLPGNGARQGEMKWKITFQQIHRIQATPYSTNALSLSRLICRSLVTPQP